MFPESKKEKDKPCVDYTIHIEPLGDQALQFPEYINQFFYLWDILRNSSVDATLSREVGLYGLAERCILFSLIFQVPNPTNVRSDGKIPGPQPQIAFRNDVPSPEQQIEPEVGRQLVGFVYLASPSSAEDEMACECAVGVSILPSARGMGIASYAVRYVLDLAFNTLAFHRVSAHVLGPSPSFEPIAAGDNGKGKGKATANQTIENSTVASERALRFFVGLGFSQEGTRRRAVPGRFAAGADGDKSWRDAHALAMLDTEWIYSEVRADARSKKPVDFVSESGLSTVTEKPTGRKYPKKTRWDEMLARHQKEQETLASVESRLKRTASTETIKAGAIIDMSMAAPGSLTSESSLSAGTSTNSEGDSLLIVSKPKLIGSGPEAESHYSSMSEDGFDVHSRSFPLPPTSIVAARERIEEYLHALDPKNFSTPGPSSPEPEISMLQYEPDAMIAEGALSVVAERGHADRRMEDISDTDDISEEELRRTDEARDFLRTDLRDRSVRASATPSPSSQKEVSPVGISSLLQPSSDPSHVDLEYEQDSEMSDAESEASAAHTDPGLGLDWERVSSSASSSPPPSEVSTRSSWTNASVSDAGQA